MSGRRASASQRTSENLRAPRAQRTGKNPRAEQTQQIGGNPMAVRTKQTGVKLGTEVTRSHTPTSREAKARVGSTHPNQDERSGQGNIFMRLGHRVDLRDRHNRRPYQERSQQSITQNRQSVLAPKGQGEISVEDLCRAITAMKENDMALITAATRSPFNQEVREARLSEGFKLPAIKAYEGKSNPQHHFDHFNDLMELHLVSELAKCKVFAVTLTRGAKKWFRSSPAGSISSWQQLSTFFLQHFQATRKIAILLVHLRNVKQKKGETLKSYINCFNDMSNFETQSPDARILAHLTNGVLLETLFWDELQQKECQNVDEFYRKAL